MFEQEIQYYCSRGSALADNQSTVSLADITLSALLPDAVKSYFKAESVWLLREERESFPPGRFDYSHRDVQSITARLEAALAPTCVFSSDEYLDTLERAVKLTFNFLCRPQLTLRSFVFRGADSLPIPDALLRISYFHDYAYFRDVLRPWLERKQASGEKDVTAKQFAETLAKIDQHVIQAMTVQDLHTLLQPMYRWISDAQDVALERIATDAFIIFFDDKGIARIADFFSGVAEKLPAISTQQACVMIEELIRQAGGEQGTEIDQEPPTSTPQAPWEGSGWQDDDDEDDADEDDQEQLPQVPPESPAPISDAGPDLAQPETEEDPSTLLPEELPPPPAETETTSIFPIDEGAELTVSESDPQSGISIEEIVIPDAPLPSPASIITEPAVDTSPSRATVFARAERKTDPPPMATIGAVMQRDRFSDRSSEFKILGSRATTPTPLVDLRTLIDDDNRKKFIKKLFRRNDPEYERALDALNELQTWREASAYIDSLFLRNGIDPYTKPAISFTDAVYGRFVRVPSHGRT